MVYFEADDEADERLEERLLVDEEDDAVEREEVVDSVDDLDGLPPSMSIGKRTVLVFTADEDLDEDEAFDEVVPIDGSTQPVDAQNF